MLEELYFFWKKKNHLNPHLTPSIGTGQNKAHSPNLTSACFYMAPKLIMVFIFLMVKKIKKNDILWHMIITWNSDFRIHKESFVSTQPCSFLPLLPLAAFALQWQSWVVASEMACAQHWSPVLSDRLQRKLAHSCRKKIIMRWINILDDLYTFWLIKYVFLYQKIKNSVHQKILR